MSGPVNFKIGQSLTELSKNLSNEIKQKSNR